MEGKKDNGTNVYGMERLGTFDEMLGCTKCDAVYHKDTRYGKILSSVFISIAISVPEFV